MKVFVAGVSHESNTFNPLLTAKDDFIIVRGEEMLDHFSGAVQVFREAGAEVVPSIYAHCMPSGVIEEEAYRCIVDEIISGIKREPDLDGIWMHLHGAIYVEHLGSGEQFLLRKIRAAVGYDIPISIGMDPHGNLSPDITNYANIIRSYHTAPHLDQQDTFRRAAQVLIDFIKRGVKVKPAFVRLPMLLCGDTALTREEPLVSIIPKLKELENSPKFAAASLFISMHSANTENSYPAVVIVPSEAEHYPAAMEKARELAEEVYSRRFEFGFEGELVSPEKALEMACASDKTPVVISDSGDNTTAGATGMNTFFLRLFLERQNLNGKKALISTIRDAEAYKKLSRLNVGDTFQLMLGTGLDEHSQPVSISGVLKSKGKVLDLSALQAKQIKPIGGLATVSVGDIDITICDRADSLVDLEQAKHGNFALEEYDIIVVKQAYQFPDLVEIAEKQIIALTPGATYQDLKAIKNDYTKLPWTLWPFED